MNLNGAQRKQQKQQSLLQNPERRRMDETANSSSRADERSRKKEGVKTEAASNTKATHRVKERMQKNRSKNGKKKYE